MMEIKNGKSTWKLTGDINRQLLTSLMEASAAEVYRADRGPVAMERTQGGAVALSSSRVFQLSDTSLWYVKSQKEIGFSSFFLCRSFPFTVQCNWLWLMAFWSLQECKRYLYERVELSCFHQLDGAWLGSALHEWSSSALSQSESSYRPWFRGIHEFSELQHQVSQIHF